MDRPRHRLDAGEAGMDLVRGSVHHEAGRTVGECFDADAAPFGGHLGAVGRCLEQIDLLAQRCAQGVGGDVGSTGCEMVVELRQMPEGHGLAEVGDGDDLSVGELAVEGASGESRESEDQGHRLGEVPV